MESLTFTVVLPSRSEMPITATSDDCLDEVAKFHNLYNGAPSDTVFVCRGQVLGPLLSLGHHGIREGDRIFVHHRRPRVTRPPFNRRMAFKQPNTTSEARRAETARISDLAFSSWEMHGQFLSLMNAILEARARREDCEILFVEETILPTDLRIREDPLPPLNSGLHGADGDMAAEECLLPVCALDGIREDVKN